VQTCVVAEQPASVPGILKAIVSTVGGASPAAHSPLMPPEAAFEFTELIASRSVQKPSLATVSAVLLTVIVAAPQGAAASIAAMSSGLRYLFMRPSGVGSCQASHPPAGQS